MSADMQTIADARQALSSGDLSRAEALADTARAEPALALDAIEVLALAAKARGADDRHEALLREAIALVPESAWPRDALAEELHGTGRLHEAETVLRETIAAQPDNPDAHTRLGHMLGERDELVEGAHHLSEAIRIAGRQPQLLADLGRNLQRQGRLVKAAPLLEEAVQAMPEALPPLLWLAELEEQAGRFDRAAALLDRAEPLALRQGTDLTLQRVTLLSRTADWPKGLAMLEAEPEPSGAALLLRGRLRDRAGRKAEAWEDFVAGKAALAHAASRSYPARAVGELVAQWRDFFTPERFADFLPAPRRKGVPQPVFILGFPRSGTALIEQVAASHSEVRAGGELPFGRELADKAALWTAGAFPRHAEAVTEEQRDTLGVQLRDHYLALAERHGLLRDGATLFTDRMPLNELYLPLLQLAFPQSPVVVVARDPRDVMVSAMGHDFTHGFSCGYRIEDLAQHYARMEELTGHWLESLPVPAHELHYEHFVADQHAQTAELMAWLGLDMEPAQLEFHTFVHHSPTPSHARIREPLNTRSIGRWTGYARELNDVLPVLAEAIERGGYAAPDANAHESGPTIN
ncbi:Tfp pilus assembly protein PilF [Novosphingobium sp. PhB165]|uniref:tetratricopeptide repeat-containing sulfotransferase family protein n=1 Tax=Novosphingobium sp. PhB165 TaxID=2485105 RepID=UPI00104E15E7|nr:sulfotransferase [Novosphingobium sp. PhB165]TCM17677.1 Tfp pilus assembly protein PilF [Novosphingobium sp. PhB165]